MSTKEQQVQEMTNVIAKFIAYVAKKLPDDVEAKIKELAADEKNPLAKTIYETMKKNQELAFDLNRPSCQDTGVLQFWVKVGSNYPLNSKKSCVMLHTKLHKMHHFAITV